MQLVNFDPLIQISEVEVILRRMFRPAPSRPTIYEWIEDGTLEGRPIGKGRTWHVYQSSLEKLIDDLKAPRQQKLAA